MILMGREEENGKRLEMLVEAVKLLKTTSEFNSQGSEMAYNSIKRLEVAGFELSWILKSIKEGKKKHLKMCSKRKCSQQFYYEPGEYHESRAKVPKFCPDCSAKIYMPRIDDPSDISSPPIQYGSQLAYGFALRRMSGDEPEFGFSVY
jgi:hypothetical protein